LVPFINAVGATNSSYIAMTGRCLLQQLYLDCQSTDAATAVNVSTTITPPTTTTTTIITSITTNTTTSITTTTTTTTSSITNNNNNGNLFSTPNFHIGLAVGSLTHLKQQLLSGSINSTKIHNGSIHAELLISQSRSAEMAGPVLQQVGIVVVI
jgi:hypothetical protein